MSVQVNGVEVKRLLGQIRALLSIDKIVYDHVAEPLEADMALVDIFEPISSRDFPWSSRTVDCGIRVTSRDRFTTLAVPIAALAAATLILPNVAADGEPIWVSVSCDTDGPEPEYWMDAAGEDEGQVEDDEENESENDEEAVGHSGVG